MATDDAATLDVIRSAEPVKTDPYLRLTASAERSLDGTYGYLLRGGLALPSGERVFLTIAFTQSIRLLSAVIVTVFLLIIGLLLFGCDVSDSKTLSASDDAVRPATAPSDTANGAAVRIAVLQDKTGSADDNQTPLLTAAQLRAAVAVCKVRGGEITFGLIRENSNHLFERLTIEPPPVPPVKEQPSGGNAIALQAARAKAQKEYDVALSSYQAGLDAWEKDVQVREGAFIAKVSRLLAQAPDAQRSDVHDAVRRADRFLAEDDAIFGAPSHRYLVAISDCIDNVRKPAPELASGATFIVVNGAGSLGTLVELQPHQFESVDAALRFIGAKEGKASLASR